MRKQISRLLWLMALPIVLGLASCAERDNPVDPNPLAKQVSGLWWTLTDQEGTYKGRDYTRIGQAVNFNDDGTGYGVTFFFNNESSEPIGGDGGKGIGVFTYTTTQDGRITLNLTDAEQNAANYFRQWTMTYAGEAVTAANGSLTLTLEHPSDQMAQTIIEWDQAMSGGAAIDDSGFNPNDPDFTRTNWRNEQGIYLYDGTGEYSFTQGGRTAKFSLVPLPWYEGTKFTNLPDHFCDDVTPENGWELVLNLCGNTKGNLRNNNFFAVYNKYSGILRFFYYLPEGFSTGNDHVWEISVSDHLARNGVWKYGLPADRTVNKAVLGQTVSGSYRDYVTPWVKNMSADGLVVPNVGWWAFDIDMSQTPIDGINPDDIISLQMRSWTTTHASLASTVAANIDGTFKGQFDITKTTVSSSKGLIESLSDIVSVGEDLYSTVNGAVKGNYIDAFKSALSFAKGAKNVYGAMTKQTTTSTDTIGKGSLSGTINLGLTGNIDTEGTISGSSPTVGIASPTIYMKDFDLANSHVGQGVWGLKSTPVVYLAQNTYPGNYRGYFFDPNSIELELNPSVFPEKDIEWIEVDALCTGRASLQSIDNDYLRTSLYGLRSMSLEWTEYKGANYSGYAWNESPLFDFLYVHDNKMGLNTQYEIMYNRIEGYFGKVSLESIIGRGADGFAIEPQHYAYMYDGGERGSMTRFPARLPFLEVNVTVRVKMKGMDYPVVLSRNYLPDIKDYGDGTAFAASAKKTRPYASKMQGHTDLYDYQMKRIQDIIELLQLSALTADDLSKLTTPYTAKDGDVLTGTLSKNVKVSIADGATVTLRNVTINGTGNYDYKWAGITCEGNATIILEGTNTAKGFFSEYPGIFVPSGKTLTIKGDGSLNASSNGWAPGIGGAYSIACGNIVIEGGTITATGGRTGAGIGSGCYMGCGNITIKGGTITATGGSSSAGIGSGFSGSCGDITITSGVTSVTATKGEDAPNSIGAGYKGSCGTVTIGGKTGAISQSPYTYKP